MFILLLLFCLDLQNHVLTLVFRCYTNRYLKHIKLEIFITPISPTPVNMCSNNPSHSALKPSEPSAKNYYYNPRKPASPSENNANKQAEQTYYAKLVNVNQQRSYVRNSNTAYPTSTRRLTDNYLNSKLAEYLNDADYEVLRNFDSVLETIPVPKVASSSNTTMVNSESPGSSTYSSLSAKTTDDQLNYSNEDEDFQKYYELEKFHSNLHKNVQKSSGSSPVSSLVKTSKSAQFNVVANAKRFVIYGDLFLAWFTVEAFLKQIVH